MRIFIWVMPEARDEEFTNDLVNRIKASAESFGVSSFSIEIRECYTNEETPHYHFKADFGNSNNLHVGLITASYSATADKAYSGHMEISFKSDATSTINSILVAGAFFLYDEAIRKYYSEWKTKYETITSL